MKWFKHYSDASLDEKICELEEDFGYIGYGVYWKILEFCALQWDGKTEPKFNLNKRKTKSILRVNYKKTESILRLCSTLNLFSVEISEKNYEIYIPNLLIIKDNHTKNLQVTGKKVSSNLPLDKNRTEQIRKDKNIYNNNLNYSPDDLIQLWNENMGEEFSYCHGFGTGKHLEAFIETQSFFKELSKWKEIFETCKRSKNLKGENNINWKVNLLWLINYDNLLKVLNGNFEGEEDKLGKWAEEWQEA